MVLVLLGTKDLDCMPKVLNLAQKKKPLKLELNYLVKLVLLLLGQLTQMLRLRERLIESTFLHSLPNSKHNIVLIHRPELRYRFPIAVKTSMNDSQNVGSSRM